MIEVRGVQANPRELRPVLKAWPGVRWSSSAPMLWLCVCAIATIGINLATRGSVLIPMGQVGMLVGVFLLAVVMTRQNTLAVRTSPTAGLVSDWRIDEAGVRFASPIHEHGFDWRGIMRVVEDEDRFIFVVSLVTNPVLPMRFMDEDQKAELRALIADVVASGRMGAGV